LLNPYNFNISFDRMQMVIRKVPMAFNLSDMAIIKTLWIMIACDFPSARRERLFDMRLEFIVSIMYALGAACDCLRHFEPT